MKTLHSEAMKRFSVLLVFLALSPFAFANLDPIDPADFCQKLLTLQDTAEPALQTSTETDLFWLKDKEQVEQIVPVLKREISTTDPARLERTASLVIQIHRQEEYREALTPVLKTFLDRFALLPKIEAHQRTNLKGDPQQKELKGLILVSRRLVRELAENHDFVQSFYKVLIQHLDRPALKQKDLVWPLVEDLVSIAVSRDGYTNLKEQLTARLLHELDGFIVTETVFRSIKILFRHSNDPLPAHVTNITNVSTFSEIVFFKLLWRVDEFQSVHAANCLMDLYSKDLSPKVKKVIQNAFFRVFRIGNIHDPSAQPLGRLFAFKLAEGPLDISLGYRKNLTSLGNLKHALFHPWWVHIGWTEATTIQTFDAAFTKVATEAKHIHFDLTGYQRQPKDAPPDLTADIQTALNKAQGFTFKKLAYKLHSRGVFDLTKKTNYPNDLPRVTDIELYLILTNPALRNKTTFYVNLTPVKIETILPNFEGLTSKD